MALFHLGYYVHARSLHRSGNIRPWYFSTMTVALIGLGFATVHAPSPYQPTAYSNICFPQPIGSYYWLMWIPVMSLEIVAFALAVSQTWIYVYQAPFRGRTFVMELLNYILQDSTRYFVMIGIMFMVHCVIYKSLPPTLERLLQSISASVLSVVGSRMMINLKDNAANVRTTLCLNTLPYSLPQVATN